MKLIIILLVAIAVGIIAFRTHKETRTGKGRKYITVHSHSRFKLEMLIREQIEQGFSCVGTITACEDGGQVCYQQLMVK